MKPGPFRLKLRVRLSETDALGVVYYGKYFSYFDVARLEMLRKAGVTLELLRRRGLGFVAAEASCKYFSSARFDDVLTISVGITKVGKSSVVYDHRITKSRKVIAEGKVTDVLVSRGGKPEQVSGDIRRRLQRFTIGGGGNGSQ